MPQRGRPEAPVLNKDQFGEVGEHGDVVVLKTSNSYELSWSIPEDNGLPIDFFLLQYYPVGYALKSSLFCQRCLILGPKKQSEFW